jgi:hypothetical protein
MPDLELAQPPPTDAVQLAGPRSAPASPALPSTAHLDDAAASVASLGDGATCYVCLDDETDGGAAPLARICDCTTGGIHAQCLEKLVNSNKARQRPLAERLQCSICGGTYTTPFAHYLLPDVLPTRLQACLDSPSGQRVRQPIMMLLGVLFVSVFGWMLFNLSALVAISVYVAVFTPLFILTRCRARRGREWGKLDDNKFYTVAVAVARREVAAGNECPPELVTHVYSHKVILVLRQTLPRGAGGDAAPRATGCCASFSSAGRREQAATAPLPAAEPVCVVVAAVERRADDERLQPASHA